MPAFLKRWALALLTVLCYACLKARGRKPARVVLCYHGVKEGERERFRRQMEHIASRCAVVKCSLIGMPAGKCARTWVSITFDDAFESILKNAIPTLMRLGLPASIFVPAGNLDQNPRWRFADNEFLEDRSEKVMNREQILELDRAGFEILSHTQTHPHLTAISESAVRVELLDSKLRLERLLDHEIPAVSYPYSDVDEGIVRIAEESGYRLGFTAGSSPMGPAADRFRIHRVQVSPRDSLFHLEMVLSGAFQLAHQVKDAARGLKNRGTAWISS